MKETVDILGIKFENIRKSDAEKRITDALERRNYMSIFTPNPDIVLGTYGSAELTKLINSAELTVPDGIGIILASRLLGAPLPERIAGIDLGEFILKQADYRGLRIFLLGGKQGVAQRAEKKITEKYPHLTVCGTHHGYFDKDGMENERIVEKIRILSPDVLFVCFGFPEQERWIESNHSAIPSLKICAGLGGSIDVWAGDTRRAPKAIQSIGAEWLWRMVLQPKRAKNILRIPEFLLCVAKQKRSQFKKSRSYEKVKRDKL